MVIINVNNPKPKIIVQGKSFQRYIVHKIFSKIY